MIHICGDTQHCCGQGI